MIDDAEHILEWPIGTNIDYPQKNITKIGYEEDDRDVNVSDFFFLAFLKRRMSPKITKLLNDNNKQFSPNIIRIRRFNP